MVAYGNLIPKKLIAGIPRGIVNIHPSLLPKHRGATPVAGAILAGDTETGVSLMVIDDKLDHGPIIGQRTFALSSDETTTALLESLSPSAYEMVADEFVRYINGEITPRPQDDALATSCKEIHDAEARIDWSAPVETIERLVRAMHGVLPAWSVLHVWSEKPALGIVSATSGRVPAPNDMKVLIHRAHSIMAEHDQAPGTLTEKENAPAVACADGYLLLDEVQLAGGKPMSGKALLNGHRDLIGAVLT
jgi:methionyl-tRNA formyltransferase